MKQIKAFFITIFSTIASLLGALAIPVAVLIISNIIDYITGIAAGPKRGQKIDSYKSFRGIWKKVCMWLLILIGALIDWMLMSACTTVGINIPFDFVVSIVVATWLVFNELISILEKMMDIGVDIPPFLMPLVKNLKKQTEDKATLEEGDQ